MTHTPHEQLYQVHPDRLHDQISDRLRALDYPQWRARVEASGGCAKPIKLAGQASLVHRDGTILHTHTGTVFAPCGNRRSTVCESCSRRYAADAFHLLRAGLSGGHKNIPTSITTKPRAFATLTAPSFGPVHTRRVTARGHVIPCACTERHHPADPRISTPLNPDTYDYTGQVLWQAHAGKLWSRFTTALRRTLAHHLGVTGRAFPTVARLSYAKVGEFQGRGLIHFHAAIRIDGPDGAADPAPAHATNQLLHEAILDAARSVAVTVARPEGVELELTWGRQIDVRDITPTAVEHLEDDIGNISEERLASYIAKYATKGTGKSEATDRPICSERHIEHLHLNPHHEQIIRTVWHLGGLAQYEELNLRKWAHMLGFRGHFLTKSQRYSTTFTAIKTERRTHRIHQLLTQLGHPDNHNSVAVIGHWQLTSIGHRNQAEHELAAAIADRSGRCSTQHGRTSWSY
jgi:hypothetical protein